jgi:hypothetical protein
MLSKQFDKSPVGKLLAKNRAVMHVW